MEPKNPYFRDGAFQPGQPIDLCQFSIKVEEGAVVLEDEPIRHAVIDPYGTTAECEVFRAGKSGKGRWVRGALSLRYQLNVISEGYVTCEARYRQQFERELLQAHAKSLVARIDVLARELDSTLRHPSIDGMPADLKGQPTGHVPGKPAPTPQPRRPKP